MTPEEALKFFKGFMEYLKSNNEDATLNNNYCKASLQAIDALEKQIPCRTDINGNAQGVHYDCPDCGSVLDVVKQPSYCEDCGQAIDWGEDNGQD